MSRFASRDYSFRMSRKQAVLVTGATGNQGGAVVEHLLRHGHPVRAYVRQPRSHRAQRLGALGAELAEGDYADIATLVAAARGMYGMFALTTPFEAGVDAEVEQGHALVDSAQQAGIEHFVYSSVASADRRTGIPHFESKHRIEQHLKKSGLPFTIVGPTFFRENFLGARDNIARTGMFSMPLAPERRLQTLCRDDLGAFVTHVFEQGSRFLGKRIDLASDSSSGPEMARAFELALGHPVRFVAEGVEEALAGKDDLSLMWAWINRVGYSANIAGLLREFPHLHWTTFERWARDLYAEPARPAAP
jgi:uncharacterized protein YbjT (DUF2867 family)